MPSEETEFEQSLKVALSNPEKRRQIVEAIVHDRDAFDLLYREIDRRLQLDQSHADSRFA